jgi:hypothetical protein
MKRILIPVLVMLMLTLAAIQMQILIGTFKLDGTDQAVTSQQAAELLPLWQVYKDLSSSDTAAQEEIDGLVQQIQDTMTPDQMRAITDMNLTRQDMFTVMQDQGIVQGRGQGDQNGNGGNFTPPEGFVPPDGGPPGGFGGGEPGGFPGGGGNRQGGQNFTPEQIATAQAARGQGGGFNRLPPGLIDALIQYLEKQAGS